MEFIEGIQTGIGISKKGAAMKAIRAIHRDYSDLRAAVASVFRGIRAGSYLHFFDTFLARSNDCRTAPCLTVNTHTVNLIVIC